MPRVMKRAARKKRARRARSMGTVAKRYRVPREVVKAIRSVAPLYGSQGRALQVGTELLVRLKKPLRVKRTYDSSEMVNRTYKLCPRTAELIRQLCHRYDRCGIVLAASVKALQLKHLYIIS
ncbi:MAG: hypothetical protein L0387_11105 [Acidobacteria bacterium]|nr:hypothetical protein [Acidobacteriota bacterium]